jgi:hypothetical protein
MDGTLSVFVFEATSLLACFSAAGRNSARLSAPLEFTISVYNEAHLKGRDLQNAQATAARVLEKAGLRILWRDASNNLTDPQAMDFSVDPPGSCPHNLGTRIVRSAPLRTDFTDLALTLLDSRATVQIAIYWDHVQAFHGHLKGPMSSGDPSLTTLLGYVLVHEVVHALLGSRAHSQSGIMRAHWGQLEFTKMAQGQFELTKTEINAIFYRCGS